MKIREKRTGRVVSVPDRLGRALVAMGKHELVESEPVATVATLCDNQEYMTRDLQAKRRGRPRKQSVEE